MHYVYEKHAHLLDEEETRKFMKQIVSALDHLHRAGIIHKYNIHGKKIVTHYNHSRYHNVVHSPETIKTF